MVRNLRRGNARSTPIRASAILTGVTTLLLARMGTAAEHEAEKRAADSEPAGLAEVTVTAERRAARLQDTPLAVSAIVGESLRDRRLQVLRDLAGEVPSLVTPGFHQNMQSVFIRGIGTTDPGVYPAVGLYIDDVYIARTFGNGLFDLPDVERVEVLRGPQGTLYGQNTSGGAIRFVSRDPTHDRQTSLDIGLGNYGSLEAHAYLNGSLVPNVLAASFAYTHRDRDGYTRNATLGRDADALRTDQFRAKLRWTSDSGLDAVWSLDGTRDRSDNANYVPLNYPGGNARTTLSNVDQPLRRNIGGTSLKLTYALSDALTLKSISAYRGFEDDPSPWDQDATPLSTYGWVQYIDQRQLTQEFQLLGEYSRLTFTAGISYFRERLDFARNTVTNGRYDLADTDLADETAGIYGQATYSLTDALSVTAGLRYNKEWQEFTNASYDSDANATPISLRYRVDGLKDSWTALTPKLALDYRLSENTLTYASVTKGEKSGGFNRAAATPTIAQIAVEPEVVTSYEIGAKTRGWGNRLQANLAVFYNDFDDYIASITNPIINGQVVSGSVVVNAARARTYGAEIETALLPARGLELNVSAAYLNAKFEEFANPTGAAASDFTGNWLPSAPKVTLSASVSYALPLELPGEVQIGGRARHVSDTYSDAANTEITRIPDQTLVDVTASYRPANRPWSLGLNVTNVFNETYRVTGTYSPARNVWTAGYNAPRFYVLSLRYNP